MARFREVGLAVRFEYDRRAPAMANTKPDVVLAPDGHNAYKMRLRCQAALLDRQPAWWISKGGGPRRVVDGGGGGGGGGGAAHKLRGAVVDRRYAQRARFDRVGHSDGRLSKKQTGRLVVQLAARVEMHGACSGDG